MHRADLRRRRRSGRRTPLSFQQFEQRLARAAIDPILVPVGDVRNAADPTTGFGRVVEPYRIGKYEVTIGEYATFLNSVAADVPAGSYTYAATGPAGITPAGATSAANRPACRPSPQRRTARTTSLPPRPARCRCETR